MRLKVTKLSNLLHFVSGLEPEHFKQAPGKRTGSGEHHTIDWSVCHLIFSPKRNSEQISWVTILKGEAWCEKGPWCAHCHLI